MTPQQIKTRLEYLRTQINAECISQREILELQSLAEHIEKDDVQLLEWAGVPEFTSPLILNVVNCGNCGEPFAHKLEQEENELTCPYCRFNDDISSFPDYFYPPHYNDSYIEIIKEKND